TQTCTVYGTSPNRVAVCEDTTTCTPNVDKRCNGVNVEICNSNGDGWEVDDTCQSGTHCVQEGNNAYCAADTSCIPSYFVCVGLDQYKQCNPTGTGYNTQADCPANTQCTVSGEVAYFPCQSTTCTPGSKQCNPAKPYEVQICDNNNNWIYFETCDYGCIDGKCKAEPDDDDDEGCTSGAKRCSGNNVEECYKGIWTFLYICPSGTTCSGGSCTSSGGGSSGGTSGGTSSGGYIPSSGGGAVSRCTSWSDWHVNSSKLKTETDSEGRKRECTNTTLMRWCMKSSGQIDFSRYEKQYQYECSAWSDECEYVYDRTEPYTDKSTDQCRTCENEIYVYTCQPSGAKHYDNVKTKTSCNEWRACTAEELTGEEEEITPQRSEIDMIIEEYGLVLGILLVVLIAVVGFTAWKMFSAEPEE
ncbi:MAG: hypothetical protein ABIH83_05650, partial [Candidatus Micrarchaeota archaeon]